MAIFFENETVLSKKAQFLVIPYYLIGAVSIRSITYI